MVLKFYASVAKGSKLRVRRFRGLIPTFVEVTGGETGRRDFLIHPILNRIKLSHFYQQIKFEF